MDSCFLSNGFCKWENVERKYKSITAIKMKIKTVVGFVIFQP